MSTLELFLFGPPHIKRDGRPIKVELQKATALLAYLAVTAQSHPRDALATLFWPDSDHTRSRRAFRQTLFVLKKALGEEWLETDRRSLTLKRGDGFWLDVDYFYELLAECQTHNHPADDVCPACLAPLTEAVTLYRDDFLAKLTLRDSPGFDEWLLLQNKSLRHRLSNALERLVRAHSAQGEFEEAIVYAKQWLALDSLQESAHRCLMHLYTQAGQHTNALRQYEKCVQVLECELGVPPQEKTVQLYHDIRENRVVQPVSGTVFPSFTYPHNIPLQPTPFVGRKKELAEVDRLLGDPTCRLLTLLGPGGIGKTRLALQAALQIPRKDVFPNGVWFVPLAPLASADFLVSTIAGALRFPFRGDADPKEQLVDYLREKEMLLLLDNFEHLLEGADFLAEMLSSVAGVKLLITSRERLNLRWEWPVEIGGLTFPENGGAVALKEYSAVELFLQGANRECPGFLLPEDEESSVVRICQMLKGVPLAIELAAAWVSTMSCREIAQKIEQNLDILATSLQDVPERHRSLRVAFDHSWDLLSTEERDVFKRFSVFQGGFRREAAEQITSASLSDLSTLLRKSLLQRSSAGCYEMLEPLRRYAEEKLQASQESNEFHELHCAYYTGFLHHCAESLKSKGQQKALKAIEEAIDNVRAAWWWAVEHEKRKAIEESLESLSLFYQVCGWLQEGKDALEKAAKALRKGRSAVKKPEDQDEIALGLVLAHQGQFCFRLSRFEEAKQLLQESYSIFQRFDTKQNLAFSLRSLAVVDWAMGELQQSIQLLQESLTIYKEIDDQWEVGVCLINLGAVARVKGEYAEAKQMYQDGLAIFNKYGDRRLTAATLNNLAIVHAMLAEYEEAKQLYQESLMVFQEIGDRWGIAGCINNLGGVALRLGEYAEARQLYQESLTALKEMGNRRGTATCLSNLGLVAEALEEYGEAREFHEQAIAISSDLGDRPSQIKGLKGLGFTLCALGDCEKARNCFDEALNMAWDLQIIPEVLGALTGISTVLAKKGKRKQAIELVAHILNHSSIDSETGVRAGQLLSDLRSRLTPQAITKALGRGKSGKLEDYVHRYKFCDSISGTDTQS